MKEDSKKSVLVVDDDLTIRKLIAHHLKSGNYEVYEANGAAEGFAYLKEKNIDLVLCDVTMEEMDGFTFCRKVREDQNYRILPFVFVTAKTSLEDKSIAMDAGGDDFITKPFNVDELLLKVRSLLRRTEIYKTHGVKKSLEQSFTKITPRILLVDDDETIAKLFQFNLQKAGFECNLASSANQALQKAKLYHPDLIISDIMMPEVDGFEFRKMVLDDENLKSIPFVILTSKDEEKDILDGYDLGITDYFVKNSSPRVVVAKVNAILNNLQSERQKIVNELNTAAETLRAKVVPESVPAFEGFEIKHWHKPFQGIPGGDFIDYFQLDENNLAIILGDVMGKKWSAWYFAFAYAGYIRSSLRSVLQGAKGFSSGEILQLVNKSVYQDSKVSEVFATLSVVVINKISKTAEYAGAGDLPILLKRNSTNEVKSIQAKGMLLGFSEDGDYKNEIINLEPNDVILMMTDGIIESRNPSGNQFGSQNLIQLLQNTDSNSDFVVKIKETLNNFTLEVYDDDISLIVIKSF
jgi:sigma-B regulation protein RsbU (phosphoserine phosphatase)